MKKIILLVVLLFLFISSSLGQNDKFKALFLYNFTKYIEWPKSHSKGDFIIGILGQTSVINTLNTIAERRKVGMQKIVIKAFESVDDIKDCHMIYISPDNSKDLTKVLSKFTKDTLIITDGKGLAKKGSCINYTTKGGNLKFEINKKNILKKGLKLNNNLMNLGKEVK